MFSLRQQLVAIAVLVLAGAHPLFHTADSSSSVGPALRIATRDADCPCVRAAVVPVAAPVLNDLAPVVESMRLGEVSCHSHLSVAQLPSRAPPTA